jgi:hypothetical protein
VIILKIAGKILISTAYLPPVEYFSLISDADEILIETEENYIKQTYRNRCYILSAHGRQSLSVPVYLGSIHKTLIKDIRIDYSKRWQQVHLGAMKASYNASPYFEYYFDRIEKVFTRNNEFLLDLNIGLTEVILELLKIKKNLTYTSFFEPVENKPYDHRYRLTPKKESDFTMKKYLQVFDTGSGFIYQLSIIDLIFNTGPEASGYF